MPMIHKLLLSALLIFVTSSCTFDASETQGETTAAPVTANRTAPMPAKAASAKGAQLEPSQTTSDPLDAYDNNGEDIIPAAFQGSWAPNKSDCNDEDGVNSLYIDATSVTAYDFRAKLIKHAGANSTLTTDDRLAESIIMLVAQSGEGEVDITRYRLATLDEKLYFDFADETKKPFNPKTGSHVRCPTKQGK